MPAVRVYEMYTKQTFGRAPVITLQKFSFAIFLFELGRAGFEFFFGGN
jgi:hypothetical protein